MTHIKRGLDLRPGGIFRTVMRSPDGQDFANAGCYLEIIENEKYVWTAAVKPGYRPQSPAGALLFTAMILLEPHGAGTRCTAIAMHGDEESAKKHASMGFHEGWGKALDQLVASQKRCDGAEASFDPTARAVFDGREQGAAGHGLRLRQPGQFEQDRGDLADQVGIWRYLAAAMSITVLGASAGTEPRSHPPPPVG